MDVSKLREGLAGRLTFDSIAGLEDTGVVQFVSPSATEKERGMPDRGEVHGFPLVAPFPSPDSHVRPGRTANLKIPVELRYE